MSLIAWYPLNGDLLDYSGNNNHLENNSVVPDDDGKIGKTYYFERGSKLTPMNQEAKEEDFQEYTASLWVMLTQSPDTHGYIFHRGSTFSVGDALFSIGFTGDRKFTFAANGHHVAGGTNITPELNKWYHLAMVDKNKKVKGYVNGELVKEFTYTNPKHSAMGTQLGIGCSVKPYAQRHHTGKINDVRLYNEALSDRQIKEISQAKILHYKFDDINSEPTKNFHTNSEFQSNWGSWDGSVNSYEDMVLFDRETRVATLRERASGTNNALHQRVSGYIVGEEYTLSLYVRIHPEVIDNTGQIKIYMNSYAGFEVSKEWKRIEITQVAKGETQTTHITQTSQIDFQIAFVQLEKKSKATPFTSDIREGSVYDYSGYGNHASVALETSPEWDSKGILGDSLLSISKGQYIKKIESFNLQTHTFSFWFKQKEPFSGTWDNQIIGNSNYRNPAVWTYSTFNGIHYNLQNSEGNKSINPRLELNKWHFICATWSEETERFQMYVGDPETANFKKVGNILVTGPLLSGGGDFFLQSKTVDWEIDDLRIYATALSEKEAKGLFENRAFLDNKGALKVESIGEQSSNGCPGFEEWTLSGGATLEGGIITIPRSGSALSPFMEIGYDNSWSFSADYFSEESRVNFTDKGGYLLSTFYYNSNYEPTKNLAGYSSNGRAANYNTKEWSRDNWRYLGGNQVKYMRVELLSNAAYTADVYKARRPMLTINDEWRVFQEYSNKKMLKEKKEINLSKSGKIAVSQLNEVGIPVRYIRERTGGSYVNSYSHWAEVKAFGKNEVNFALGAEASHKYYTDGKVDAELHSTLPLDIDLGRVETIHKLHIWHYWADGRTYRDVKTEVSVNGIDWVTVFDSNIDGEYPETEDGHEIFLYPSKMSIDAKGNLFVQALSEI